MRIGSNDTEFFEMVLFHEMGADLLASFIWVGGPHDVVAVSVGLVNAGGGDEDVLINGEVDVKIASGIVIV